MDSSDKQAQALALYSEASICEREGRLGDALMKFRLATRLEPNIDRIVRNRSFQVVPSEQAIKDSEQSEAENSDIATQTYYSFESVDHSAVTERIVLDNSNLVNESTSKTKGVDGR
ncbi:hypothetical protein HDU84_004033 [Entophlyctis sp. JEL0112]|nr:hypothetical protein HDU84_004033 [Entophlyctis sp. JEL0112]